ncbi:hypothetical protein, partial [Streptomyces mirabilis]|uniref:hypothetical protein n=1 Tax=Streptomyces mirabilis TaxID=68239 RepID=UPI0036D9FD33
MEGAVGGARDERGRQVVRGRRRAVHDRGEDVRVHLRECAGRCLVQRTRDDPGAHGAEVAHTDERDDVRREAAPDVVEEPRLPRARPVDLVDEDLTLAICAGQRSSAPSVRAGGVVNPVCAPEVLLSALTWG